MVACTPYFCFLFDSIQLIITNQNATQSQRNRTKKKKQQTNEVKKKTVNGIKKRNKTAMPIKFHRIYLYRVRIILIAINCFNKTTYRPVSIASADVVFLHRILFNFINGLLDESMCFNRFNTIFVAI